MGSLLDMLNCYKEKEANSAEEIDKLEQLSVIKDDEIINLDVELQSLRDFMSKVRQNQEDKIRMYTVEIEKNSKVILRTDKLIVDLQQKNEVSQNAVIITQKEAEKKNDQKDKLQMKMKELSDQREYFHESISNIEGKMHTVRSYLQNQSIQKQPHPTTNNIE